MSIDRQLDKLEERLAHVEELIAQLVWSTQQLRTSLAQRAATEMISPAKTDARSHFVRIADFLLAQGNRLTTARAIADGAGISRSSLSQILHRTHKDSFISRSIPGYSRKKLWALTDEAVRRLAPLLSGSESVGGLFDSFNLAGKSGKECCIRILEEHSNVPMNALTLAREAIDRGYQGRAEGSLDDVLLTTAKSFWALMGRDERFEEVRPQVFALRGAPRPPP